VSGSTEHLRRSSTRLGGRFLARLEREDGASISALAQPFAIKLAGRDEASRCA